MIMMVEETWRRLANYYETLIDVTQFSSVRRYLCSGSPPITGVIFVRQQQFLAKVAAALDERDIRGQDRLRRWLEQGHICVAKSDELLIDGPLSESNISNDCSCDLIFCPPFYVVFLHENASVVFHCSPSKS